MKLRERVSGPRMRVLELREKTACIYETHSGMRRRVLELREKDFGLRR